VNDCLTPRCNRFTVEEYPVPIVQEAFWASGLPWTGAKNLASAGIRSPDPPARSESLYTLHYPGLFFYKLSLSNAIRTIKTRDCLFGICGNHRTEKCKQGCGAKHKGTRPCGKTYACNIIRQANVRTT
jgi:hypothetical protein